MLHILLICLIYDLCKMFYLCRESEPQNNSNQENNNHSQTFFEFCTLTNILAKICSLKTCVWTTVLVLLFGFFLYLGFKNPKIFMLLVQLITEVITTIGQLFE